MPTFSFTSVAPKPKTNKKYNKVTQNVVEGIVWIDIEGNYYLLTEDGKTFSFTKDSYNTKSVEKVYVKRIEKRNRCIFIRNGENLGQLDSNYYSPFGVGCHIKGHIVNNCVKFDKILHDYIEGLSTEAIKYFRINKTIIKNAIKCRLKSTLQMTKK